MANGTATGCAWDGTTLSASTSGTCTLTITKATDTNYNATTATATFTFSKATQSALTIDNSTANYNSTITLTTSGGLGSGAVTYVVNSGNCSVSGATLSNTSAGTCSVTATKAGDGNYESISSSATTITVSQIAQSALSFTLSTSSKSSPYSQVITFTPSGGSGTGTTTYAIVSGGTATGCALANNTSSNTISATTSGTCLIAATKAGDTNYTSITSSNQSFTFSKATQSALSIAGASGIYGTTLTLSTSGGSSGAGVSYVVNSGSCSVSGATLSNSAAGDCYITATMAANVDYEAISSASTKITIAKATQSALTIDNSTANYNSTITLTTSGGLGSGAVTYVVNSGNCSVSGATLSNTSAGTCSVTATKAASANYEAISSSPTTITVNQIAQGTLTISVNINSKTYPYSQVIALGSSGGSGSGAITYAISSGGTATGCALSGTGASNTISATTSGTCLIKVSKAGDTNYTDKTSTASTFTFNRAEQSALSITNTTASYGTPLTLATSGGTGTGAITYSVSSGPCTVSGNLSGNTTLNYSAAGTCVLTATKARDDNYEAKTSSSASIVVNRVAVTTTVSSATDLTLVVIRSVYLQTNPIAANINTPGKVTFTANGLVIPGCTAVKTTGTGPVYTSTCQFRPTSLGTITISATINPNDPGFTAVTKSLKVVVSPK